MLLFCIVKVECQRQCWCFGRNTLFTLKNRFKAINNCVTKKKVQISSEIKRTKNIRKHIFPYNLLLIGKSELFIKNPKNAGSSGLLRNAFVMFIFNKGVNFSFSCEMYWHSLKNMLKKIRKLEPFYMRPANLKSSCFIHTKCYIAKMTNNHLITVLYIF